MGIALTEQQAWEKLRDGQMLMRYLPKWEEMRESGKYSVSSWYVHKWDVLWLDETGKFEMRSQLTGLKSDARSIDFKLLEGKWEEVDFGRFKASNPDFLQDALDWCLEQGREFEREITKLKAKEVPSC